MLLFCWIEDSLIDLLQVGWIRRLLMSQEDHRKFDEICQQLDIASRPLDIALQARQ